MFLGQAISAMGLFKTLVLYFSTLALGFAIDLVWLGLMNSRFYKPQLAGLMSEKVNWVPAFLFYVLFIVGMIVLVVIPAVDKGSWLRAMLTGGLLGMVAYATYDLTNLATLNNWPAILTVVDIAWGTVFSAAVASVSYFIARALS
jgi:uncharacterized membrane protein